MKNDAIIDKEFIGILFQKGYTDKLDTMSEFCVEPNIVKRAYDFICEAYNIDTNRIRTILMQSGLMSVSRVLLSFTLDAYMLSQNNVDIKPLIASFNRGRSVDMILHNCSLAWLTRAYSYCGHNVIFLGELKNNKRPDFKLDGILCDLKTRMGYIENLEMIKGTQPLSDLMEIEFKKSLRNRLLEGIKQGAEIIFIDSTRRTPAGFGMVFLDSFLPKTNIFALATPKEYSVIFFSKNHSKLIGHSLDLGKEKWDLIKEG